MTTRKPPDKTRILHKMATGLDAKLEKGLLGYAVAASAAGVSMLALAPPPAEAKIVYTAAHMQIIGNVDLDLNHDGIKDFRFSTIHYTYTVAAHAQTSGRGSIAQLRVYPVGTRNQIWGRSSYASALKPGVSVGPKFSPGGFSMVQAAGISGNLGFYGSWQGTKSNRTVKNHYVGLRFLIKGQVHYGWARLTVTAKYPISATLTGYAYETVANKAIVTGKTKGPGAEGMEPAANESRRSTTLRPESLGMLARGAAGLAVGQKRGSRWQ